MRQGQQNKQRIRGRNNTPGNSNGNRKGPNPLTRTYESSGPEVKIRGTALHIAEKYSQLARDASSAGDRVMAENYLQHAEHYYRIIAAAQAQSPQIVFSREEDDAEDEYEAAAERAASQPEPAGDADPQPMIERPGERYDRQAERAPRQDMRQDRYDRPQRVERAPQFGGRNDRQPRFGNGDRNNGGYAAQSDDGQPRFDRPDRNAGQDRNGGQDRFNRRDQRPRTNFANDGQPGGERISRRERFERQRAEYSAERDQQGEERRVPSDGAPNWPAFIAQPPEAPQRPDSNRSDSNRSELTRSEPAQSEAVRGESIRNEPAPLEAPRIETAPEPQALIDQTPAAPKRRRAATSVADLAAAAAANEEAATPKRRTRRTRAPTEETSGEE